MNDLTASKMIYQEDKFITLLFQSQNADADTGHCTHLGGCSLSCTDGLYTQDCPCRRYVEFEDALWEYTVADYPCIDSITAGARSSTHDGYRAGLVNLLDGNQVNMVGYRTSGAARDTQYQAHDGWFVNNMDDHLNDTFPAQPNVYLLHGGTNDIQAFSHFGRNCTGPNADTICMDRANLYAPLIDRMLNTGALVVVAQITPANASFGGGSLFTSNLRVFNSYIEKIVRARDYPGTRNKIQLVNMQQTNGGVTLDDLSDDNLHPLDGGYAKMAKIWYAGLQNASTYGLIPAPNATMGYPVEPCPSPFSTNYTNGQIVPSRGASNYYPTISCSNSTDGTANCTCNDGGANFTVPRTGSCKEMSLAFVTAVRWADLNGDGRQENFRINANGTINASLNLGILNGGSNNYTITGDSAGDAANPKDYTLLSRFRDLGVIGPSGINTKPYQVRLADLDGDARAEFLVVNPDGTIKGYYNTGSMHTLDNNILVNWASTADNTVATSFGVSGVGVRLVDFDGDGRADYVWVSANGALQVWLNKANQRNSAAVTNWVSQGSVGPPVLDGTYRENIVLADVDGDGRADFIILDRNSGAAGCYLNKKPATGSTTPQWQWINLLVTADQVKALGGVQFLDEVNVSALSCPCDR